MGSQSSPLRSSPWCSVPLSQTPVNAVAGTAMLSWKEPYWPVALGLMAPLCFLLGPALCGPSDCDAVFHLCSDWDAGMRNSASLVSSQPPEPYSSLSPGLCSYLSLSLNLQRPGTSPIGRAIGRGRETAQGPLLSWVLQWEHPHKLSSGPQERTALWRDSRKWVCPTSVLCFVHICCAQFGVRKEERTLPLKHAAIFRDFLPRGLLHFLCSLTQSLSIPSGLQLSLSRFCGVVRPQPSMYI